MTVTFERTDTGREIAYMGTTIIADITPDGFGKGGWVTLYSAWPRRLEWVATREDGRALIRTAATKTAAKAAPAAEPVS